MLWPLICLHFEFFFNFFFYINIRSNASLDSASISTSKTNTYIASNRIFERKILGKARENCYFIFFLNINWFRFREQNHTENEYLFIFKGNLCEENSRKSSENSPFSGNRVAYLDLTGNSSRKISTNQASKTLRWLRSRKLREKPPEKLGKFLFFIFRENTQ